MAGSSCSNAPKRSAPARCSAIAGLADGSLVSQNLAALSPDETLAFVRGFMLFSMLANLAEDRHGRLVEREVDLRQQPAGTGGSRHQCRAGRRAAGPVADRAGAHRAPHRGDAQEHAGPPRPHRRADAPARWRRHRNAPGGDLIEQAILRQIALLWQTRPLRRERMLVRDEVEIALAYLRDVFLPVLPRLYARWDRLLPRRPASFLRLGSWIGGDRDGNPQCERGDACAMRCRPVRARCSTNTWCSCIRWARSCRSPPSSPR